MQKFTDYLKNNQIIFALALLLVLWFLYQIRLALVVVFLAYLIMAGFWPVVSFLRSKKWPKILAVLVPYLPFLGLLVAMAVFFVPNLASQIQSLGQSLPNLINAAGSRLRLPIDLSGIFQQASGLAKNLFTYTGKAVEFVLSLVTVFVLSIYMLIERDRVYESFANLFSGKTRERVKKVLPAVESDMGKWLLGQLLLSVIVGTAVWIFLWALGINFSGSLGIMAGILELVPYVGPILSAIPGVIVALGTSLAKALAVVVGYVVIQQLENHLLVPNIMKASVGLNPLVVIVAVIAGAEMAGIVGALIAVPVVALVWSVTRHLKRYANE